MRDRRRNMFLLLIIAGGGLLVLASLVILLNRPPQPMLTATPASLEQVERVSVEQAKTAFDQGEAVFLDVRSKESYAASHVLGAVSIPGDELTARLGELDRSAWIIPY